MAYPSAVMVVDVDGAVDIDVAEFVGVAVGAVVDAGDEIAWSCRFRQQKNWRHWSCCWR